MAAAQALLRGHRGLSPRQAFLWALALLLFAGPARAALDLHVEGPRLRAERLPDSVRGSGPGSSWDIELDLGRMVVRDVGAPGPQRLRLVGARLSLRGSPGEHAAGQLDFEGTRPGRGLPWTGQLQVALERGRLATGVLRVTAPARLSGAMELRGPRIALRRATLRAERLSVERVEGRQLETQFDFADDILRIGTLRTRWCEGGWEASGTVWLARKRFDGQLKAEGADLDRLGPALLGRALGADLGTLDLEGHFSGDWSDPETWLDRLAGEGRFSLAGGALPSYSLLSAVWAGLFERIPGVAALRLDRAKATPTQLVSVSPRFVLGSSRVRTEDVRIETDDYFAKGPGAVGLDGSLDLDLRVRFTNQGARKVFSMASVPVPTLGAEDLVSVGVRARGSFGEPSFAVDASSVPTRTLLRVFGHIGGVQRALGGLLGRGLGVMRDGMEKIVPDKSDPR